MTTKEDWVSEINRLAAEFSIADARLELRSPQFVTSEWQIGVEHKRRYRSIVLRWLGVPTEQPPSLSDWRPCPASDRARRWTFRVYLEPTKLGSLLRNLATRPRSIESWNAAFEARVRESRQEPADRRNKRLELAGKTPRRIEVTATVFERNPDVVAAVLVRAGGVCEGCKHQAPFNRRSDQSPYLEVHHNKPLSEGGEDSVENAIALCPNCHRKKHYG